MDSIILTSATFVDFLFFIGFWILGLKILALLSYKILSNSIFEDFFAFCIVSIVEMVLGVLFLMKTLLNPNPTFALITVFYMIAINLAYLIKSLDYTKKNRQNWGDFWYMSIISVFCWVIYIGVIRILFF